MKRIIIIFFCINLNLCAINIDRLILSSDNKADYIEFWPHVSRWWQQIIGIKNITLAFVGPLDKKLPYEEIIFRFLPIPGIEPGLQAQLIRLLIPCLYPEETCLIGDIDMIPLNREFLIDFVKHVPEDHVVVYHQYSIKGKVLSGSENRYPMCYIAAKGKLFAEIFQIQSVNDFTSKIKKWAALNTGFYTDELVLFSALNQWNKFETHCTIIDIYPFYSRRMRRDLEYDQEKLKNNFYFDAHCPRPYSQHYTKIEKLVADRLAVLKNN